MSADEAYGYVPILDPPSSATAPEAPNPTGEGLGSCIHCRRRKVRCDKKTPCANCVRLGFQCELAPRKRAPRRPRKDNVGHQQSAREVELVQRLNKLEGIVKSLGGQVEEDSSRTEADAGISSIAKSAHSKHGLGAGKHGDGNLEKDFGILMLSDEGQSRYISRNFFSRLNEEVNDIRRMVFEDYPDHEDTESPDTVTTIDEEHHGYVFGYSSTALNLRELHPLPSQLPFYLKMYCQRVDPVIKMLHIPSMEVLVEEAQKNLNGLSRSEEALLFSIYFAVVVSMSALDVKSSFGFDRTVAIDRYRFGAEQSLPRADFLDTSDPMTLQAFVIYLTILRTYQESRKAWTLTRTAIGIAQSLGLHRDGTAFDLPPFEVEIRRRLWWQIFILDFRMSEKHGTEPSIMEGSFDTKRPLNINDADISPDDTVFPEAKVGLTEMSITLIACEIAFAAPNLLKSPKESGMNFAEKEERIKQYRQLLEERYLKHCTENTPISWVVSMMPRLVIAKITTLFLLPYTRLPSNDASSKELNDKMFVTSIEVVELRRMLEAEITKHWHWYLCTIIQWHSIAYLLSELCVRDPDDNVSRAWNVLDMVFKDWRNLQQHGAPAILQTPMKKLIARARHKRAMDLEAARAAEVTRLKTPDVAGRDQYLDNSALSTDPLSLLEPTNIVGNVNAQSEIVQNYGDEWLQQQASGNIPAPWLLEDTALHDLGFNPTEIGPDMDWELNNWLDDFTPAYTTYT